MDRQAQIEFLDPFRRIGLLTGLVAATAGTVIPLLVDMKVDWISFLPLVLLTAMIVWPWPYFVWRRMTRLQVAAEGFVLTFLMSIPILVLSYSAMKLDFPLADSTLAGMDAWFGFDVPAIVLAVDRHPMLADLLRQAYRSLSPQLLLLPVILALAGRFARVYGLAACYFILCAISFLITIFFPAIGTIVHYGLGNGQLAHVSDYYGHHFLASFTAVREDPAFVLSLGVASGIVTFPSIHAGMAVLCAWAAWPLRLIRWPMLALNAAMFASAISNGSHYVVDVVAGGLIACLAIAIVRSLFARAARPGTVSPSGRDAPAGAAAAH